MVTNTMIAMVTNSIRFLRDRQPPTRQERAEVVLVGHGRQTSKQVLQVGQGILPVPFAGDDKGVGDGRALARIGMANKQPVFLS